MPEDDRPFLFVIGASYHHKNRVFAVAVLSELRSRGWDGFLVLAGPTPPRGNSIGDEAIAALRDASIADHVVVLGDLSESEKSWIYERAALSLYPTSSEGFGLVPFESAQRGVPVLPSRQGSLDEVLPTEIVTFDSYDIAEAADRAWELLHNAASRSSQCRSLVERSKEYTWERTAQELIELFDQVLQRGRNNIAAIWGEGPAPAQVAETEEPKAQRAARLVEEQLQRLLELENLKRAAVPVGSRRQDFARKGANWARRSSRRI